MARSFAFFTLFHLSLTFFRRSAETPDSSRQLFVSSTKVDSCLYRHKIHQPSNLKALLMLSVSVVKW